MNKEQYEELSQEQKDIAKEAYIDGFRACIFQVKSVKVAVGDASIDGLFVRNREMIVSTLQSTIENMVK